MSKSTNSGNNGSGNSPANDSGLNLQEIIQMGELASQALNNPIYHMAHRMAVDQAILEWSSTSAKEKEKRDSLWHEVQAHGRVAQHLHGFIERAQQVLAEQNRDPEKDYRDRQGFGFEPNYGQQDTFQ